MANSNPLAAIAEIIAGVARTFQIDRDAIEAGLRRFSEFMERAEISFQEAQKERAELYPKLRVVMGPLAKRGWFISGNFGVSELMELARRCDSMSDRELDDWMASQYRSSLDEHGESLVKDYPHRAFAIKPALDAHTRGEFALSIPVFFAQAEGICFETLNKYIFTKGKGPGGADENIKAAALERLHRSKANQNKSDPFDTMYFFMEMMWLPFAEQLPVGYGPKERRLHNYEGLNRNTVMHGLDLEYATEENSLKAFSMLSHIGTLLHNLAADEDVFSWYEKG